MSSALETICGQAYGAQQYQKVGKQTYTGIFCLLLVCLPLSLFWVFMGKLLVLMGQDPVISHEAGKFIVCLIPALFAYATLQALVRYFQTQSLIFPLLLSSCVTLCFHIAMCWALVFKSTLGHRGGALAIGLSYWLNVILLGSYMKYASACAKTRASISMEMFQGIGEFFRFAIPSTVMIWWSFCPLCFSRGGNWIFVLFSLTNMFFHGGIHSLEWWSFELLTFLAGLLPNPELEASVLSIWYI